MSRLSPAEKFDLLVGAEANRGLANYSWQDGKRIFDAMGEIEGWFGLCHGWAPAAYEMHRPYKTLTLVAADGKTKIDFRPDDLKALYTYWWSTNDFSTRFVGSRCETASPATDPDSGRIVEANCYDNNAATWHLAVVNQVGVNRSSFIIDASLDRQVWNQPVKSYSFTYFNPKTDTEAQDWQTGKVNLSDFPEDKFKKFRSPRAVAVVGIAMNLSYLAEHGSNPIDTDTADQDSVNTVHYVYDLEIDAQGTIVGGEWYQNYHPDFLWMPVRGTRPSHSLDRQLTGVWDLAKPIPENWKKPAQTASRSGHILGPILEKINQTFANP